MILAASDLHVGARREGDRAVAELAARLALASPEDVLILAGDLAEGLDNLHACLALFEHFPGKKLAIAGNHDVWVGAEESSWDRYRALPAVFREHGFVALEEGPITIDGVTFVGSLGWYDYSFRDDLGIADEAYASKIYPGMTRSLWRDSTRVRWGESDAAITEWQLARLRSHLALAPAGQPIVAAVHHVPVKAHLIHPRALVPRFFRFVNAFLGSERFGELLAADERVKWVVSGHIHHRGLCRRGAATFVSIGGDYREKELLRIDLAARDVTRETIHAPAPIANG